MQIKKLLVAIIFAMNPMSLPTAFAGCDMSNTDNQDSNGWLGEDCWAQRRGESEESGRNISTDKNGVNKCDEAGRAAISGCEDDKAAELKRQIGKFSESSSGVGGGADGALQATNSFIKNKDSQIKRCKKIVDSCKKICGGKNAACAAGERKGEQAAADKEKAEEGKGGMEILAALVGLAGLFMKDKKKKPAVAKQAEEKTPADIKGATGGLTARSGYRSYQTGDTDSGEANAPGFNGNLAESSGKGTGSGGSGGRVGSAGVAGGPSGSGGGSSLGGAPGAATAPGEAFDTQLSSGFYKGGGASGGGSGITTSDGGYSSGGSSSRRYGMNNGRGFSANSASKLRAVLNRARSLGRAPAGIASQKNSDSLYRDNFSRIRERYKRMNKSEALEELK